MTGEHIRGIPRTYEKEITLADTPYTLSVGFNCVKVDTTGGNVRVNLPDTNYPIDVIKTSSDAYIVTVWVGGTQIGEVAGELSKITIENAEVTKDEPWFPYDAIVGIAGVSGDGGEVLAKDRFGRVIAGGRGVAGTDDLDVMYIARNFMPFNGRIKVTGDLILNAPFVLTNGYRDCVIDFSGSTLTPGGDNILIDIDTSSYIKILYPIIRLDTTFDHTEPAIRIRGTANSICSPLIYCGRQQNTHPIFKLRSASWFNDISGASFKIGSYAPTLLQLDQESTSGIQGNIFENWKDYAGGVSIEFVPYGNTYTGLNIFRSWQLEASSVGATKTTQVLKNVDGQCNRFDGVNVFDLPSTSITFNTLVGAINTSFFGGVWKKPGYYTDLGIGTMILQDVYYNLDNMINSFMNSLSCNSMIPGNCETSSDLAAWTAIRGTKELSTVKTYVGRKSIKFVGSDALPGIFQDVSSYSAYIGQYVTFGAWLYVPSTNVQECKLHIGTGTVDPSAVVVTERDTWVYKTITALVPISATRIRPTIYLGAISNTDIVYISFASVCPGNVNLSTASFGKLLNDVYRSGNSGSSTGTGSEQTIAHGLAAIPVGCKAWITYLVGTRYVTEMIPFDATNVYPTVATGTAYNWRIE